MTRRTKWITGLPVLVFAIAASAAPARAADLAKRLTDARAVYQELITAPDREVPKELLERAKCIAVFPGVIKAAIAYGARHGNGVMTCRGVNGRWSPPAFVSISGGSVGFQLGAESTDLVLFFMNDRGANSLMNGSRITLGGKASIAAGPFGRSGEAGTNLELKAEIYSYARTRGLFAGLSLEGARLAPSSKDNEQYYGKGVSASQLLFGHAPGQVPTEAEHFREALP